MNDFTKIKKPKNATAVLILADKTLFWGNGIGHFGTCLGEICFNTSITGYQEVLTDPSYAGQIISFTFPHIGNVGTNQEDAESAMPAAKGLVIRQDITEPSNWRASQHLNQWLQSNKITGICNVDTRALSIHIRDQGALTGIICYNSDGIFDLEHLFKKATAYPGLIGMDLAKEVTCKNIYKWDKKTWSYDQGYRTQTSTKYHVVAVDFGAKQNILRCLCTLGCRVTVVPAATSAKDILDFKPDGIFLSNGPGDPAATAEYAVPTVQTLIESGTPIFGICLGHQILSLALGAKTKKMHLGHRGANHPVKDLKTGKVEITSQNHGFEVITESLPDTVQTSHVSLFDGSNEGIKVIDQPIFSVQYHPEASPGPHDSSYLFDQFVSSMS